MEGKNLLKRLAELLPSQTYLVGGFVRDLLLGRQSYDIDLITEGEPEVLAQRLASELKGTYFGFKKENLPVREKVYTVIVPYEGKRYRIDLSQFSDLKRDLSERDFTVNAIAMPLKAFSRNKKEVIDFFGGLEDLKNRTLRAVKLENLLSDPLRMLRAYRFARQLKFQIDPATREFIKKHKEKLREVAPERVVVELFKAVKPPQSHLFFEETYNDSVLKTLFGPINKNEFLNFLKLLKEIEKNVPNFEFLKSHRTYLGEFDEDTAVKWLSFFVLVPSAFKALDFYPFGEEFKKCVKKTLEGIDNFSSLQSGEPKDFYFYLKRFESCLFPIAVILSVKEPQKVEELVEFYLKRFLPNRKPLLGGREIMELLKLKPSPLVGQILEALTLAQIEGKVKGKEDAKSYIFKILANGKEGEGGQTSG